MRTEVSHGLGLVNSASAPPRLAVLISVDATTRPRRHVSRRHRRLRTDDCESRPDVGVRIRGRRGLGGGRLIETNQVGCRSDALGATQLVADGVHHDECRNSRNLVSRGQLVGVVVHVDRTDRIFLRINCLTTGRIVSHGSAPFGMEIEQDGLGGRFARSGVGGGTESASNKEAMVMPQGLLSLGSGRGPTSRRRRSRTGPARRRSPRHEARNSPLVGPLAARRRPARRLVRGPKPGPDEHALTDRVRRSGRVCRKKPMWREMTGDVPGNDKVPDPSLGGAPQAEGPTTHRLGVTRPAVRAIDRSCTARRYYRRAHRLA